MRIVLGVMLALVARAGSADESTPRKPPADAKCEAPPMMVVREIERLLKSAAEHATRSQVCVDGGGERTTIQLLAACVVHPRGRPNDDVIALQVSARYRVTVAEERGGECSPYPDCAKTPPPRVGTWGAGLDFTGSPEGLRLAVPDNLGGVPLKTPLKRAHSTGCYGESAAFVPRLLR